MSRFFRKIREKLLTQNKFSKYLIYATGEVILIVIGILVALAINNWNQDRIARDREKFYLQGLRSEFELSKIKLQNLIAINRVSNEEAQKLATILSKSEELPQEKELSESLYNAFSYELLYNPNNSLLNEMINSGRMEDISNEELRKHLSSWESFIQSINGQEAALREQREKMVSFFLAENGSIRTIFDDTGVSSKIGLSEETSATSNLPIIKSREFENNLLLFLLAGISTEKSHYEPLLQEINTILGLLDKELEDS